MRKEERRKLSIQPDFSLTFTTFVHRCHRLIENHDHLDIFLLNSNASKLFGEENNCCEQRPTKYMSCVIL